LRRSGRDKVAQLDGKVEWGDVGSVTADLFDDEFEDRAGAAQTNLGGFPIRQKWNRPTERFLKKGSIGELFTFRSAAHLQ
jgi:hypothetical protein